MASIRLREPFSGLSHLAGMGLAIAGTVVLLVHSRDVWMKVSFSIYGATAVLLYFASALLHLLPVGPRAVKVLLKLDQCAIYLLIAGCYTPLCLVRLRGGWGWSLFGIVWGLAILGIVLKASWKYMPAWCDMLLYLLMGWLAVIGFGPLHRAIGTAATGWLIAGGVTYSVGSYFYLTDRPLLWPGRFSAHDLWHLFVLAGSAFHFLVMVALLRS